MFANISWVMTVYWFCVCVWATTVYRHLCCSFTKTFLRTSILLVGVSGVLGVAGLSVSVTHTASSNTDVFDAVVILEEINRTQLIIMNVLGNAICLEKAVLACYVNVPWGRNSTSGSIFLVLNIFRNSFKELYDISRMYKLALLPEEKLPKWSNHFYKFIELNFIIIEVLS